MFPLSFCYHQGMKFLLCHLLNRHKWLKTWYHIDLDEKFYYQCSRGCKGVME